MLQANPQYLAHMDPYRQPERVHCYLFIGQTSGQLCVHITHQHSVCKADGKHWLRMSSLHRISHAGVPPFHVLCKKHQGGCVYCYWVVWYVNHCASVSWHIISCTHLKHRNTSTLCYTFLTIKSCLSKLLPNEPVVHLWHIWWSQVWFQPPWHVRTRVIKRQRKKWCILHCSWSVITAGSYSKYHFLKSWISHKV